MNRAGEGAGELFPAQHTLWQGSKRGKIEKRKREIDIEYKNK